MVPFESERELLQAVRDRLDDWLYPARAAAYEALFEGPEPALSAAELRTLDAIDSRLAREEGMGLWGADTYDVVETGTLDEETTAHVVCTNHPQLPSDGYPGVETLDDETRARMNGALWDYSEQVVERLQHELERFDWSAAVERRAE